MKVSTRMLPRSVRSNPCCCLNVKTGAILIAIFEIISWSIILSVTTYSLAIVTGIMDSNESGLNLRLQYPDDITSFPDIPDSRDIGESPIPGISVMLVLSIGMCIVRLVNSTVLIFGVLKSSTRMVKIWLCVKIVSFFVTMGFFVASLANGTATIATDGVYGFSLVATMYFVWIIVALLGTLNVENQLKHAEMKP